MDLAIAIFVKTPGLSELKSRLAQGTSRAFAIEWYTRSLRAVRSVIEQTELPLYLAVSEREALAPNSLRWADFPRQIWQGEQPDLGAKMHTVMQQLLQKHAAVMLLGADLPHLHRADLVQARDALAAGADYVLGKAFDGGFWTFASQRLPSMATFRSVTYSSASTAEQFQKALAPGRWDYLRELSDVDFADDLPACASAMAGLPAATTEQRCLLTWMQNSSELARFVLAPQLQTVGVATE
jgi:uncharacterized protein